ncbi:MAG: tetratricopeptide repeat protein [Desulfobacteraceae bacterium]|jgi:tetratricopeptide (TPR) repeat protein|nr:tetratricopeptide repeat protein [Desulfobacteraceae bacterium]
MKSKPAILIYFSCLFAAALVFSFSGVAPAEKTTAAKSRTAKEPAGPVKKDADYWFNKGALVSTYGNNKAAVQYFQKAIALDPNFGRAYFSQGVSYGQLGQYPKAIAQINMALKMEPQSGMYYYGRGRVYLLWGDRAKAMDDFKKAAELGDEDALNYLDYIGESKK